jgi:hypothetical protein
LLEPSREIAMGLEGGLYGFGSWKMKFLSIQLISAGVFFFFAAGKMPANNILYNILWVQEDERRARIVNAAEKIMAAAGMEPMTLR